jgi:hypothetical protein
MFFIPSQPIVFRGGDGKNVELSTGEIAVEVVSVIAGKAEDIRDIKPPLEITYFPVAALVLVIVIAVVAASVIILYVRRKRRPGKIKGAPPPPPHVIAYMELREIVARKLVEAAKYKEYYTALSGVVRRYIEGRFGLKAPDRTTEEFLEEAKVSGLLDPRARTLVGDFLEKCDMVKFAKYGPSNNECEAAYISAKKFVDETKEAESGV